MAFFENCPALQVTIYFQMAFSMMFNAFLFAFFYNRLARCEARATQLLFSNKAVIRMDSTGKMVLEVQVYDSDAKHPVVEAHVRIYLVHACSNESIRRANYSQLRIFRPNDEFNAMLFTSIPSRIIHHIDSYSPLLPPQYHNESMVDSYGLTLREMDSWTGNREGLPCPACGETFGTYDRLWKHIRYNQLVEKSSGMEVDGPHQQLGDEDDEANHATKPKISTFADMKEFWNHSGMELIVIVEGIDPLTSGTFQALQSYQKEDVVFGGTFSPCFTDNNMVDFDLFHTILKEDVEEEQDNEE